VTIVHKEKNSIFPLLLITFIGTLGYSIVLPFLVFLVVDLGGNAIVYGIISAMYPAFQLIGAPILGRWSDIYGRKKFFS
jgi:MFS family permease